MADHPNKLDLSQYLRGEPMKLVVLSLGVIFAFLLVAGISRAFSAQEAALAERWSARGSADLTAGNYEAAIQEFRAALLYSRDDFNFRLGLAQALIGVHRTAEAYNYLINLRNEHPENGLVNLELARIEADRHDSQAALRFYHNAIYANWPGDQEKQEREAHFELVNYLLKINARNLAQSELISLAAAVGDDAAAQERLGKLFLGIQDDEHALAAFRRCLAIDEHNTAARAGAGAAAFNLGRYPMAVRYLRQAVATNPNDSASSDRLRVATLVLALNPFQAQLRVAQKYRKVVAAFAAAGITLKACPVAGSFAPPDNPKQELSAQWNNLNPHVTERGLKADPDMVNTAMSLVFSIERQANEWCGKPTPTDSALLLIAGLREGN